MRGRSIPNWVWLVLALTIVGVVQVVSGEKKQPPPPLDPSSARPNGALALNLWLRRVGYRVQAAASPSLTGASWRAQDTLVLLAPEADPTIAARRSLSEWVRRGGRLVIIPDGSATTGLLSTFGFSVISAPSAPIHVVQPLLIAPAVERLGGRTSIVLASVSTGIEVAGTSYGPIVMRKDLGRGVVWIASAPALLANGGIARADNRRLALNLAGPPGSRVGLDVITLRGPPSQPNSSTWLTNTTWGAVVLFGILVVLLYRGLAGRRLGPPIEPPGTSFRPAVEYALSMAGLLRRGQKRTEALLPYQRSLRRLLQRRAVDAVPAEVEALLEGGVDLTERELISRAAAIVEYEEEAGRRHG